MCFCCEAENNMWRELKSIKLNDGQTCKYRVVLLLGWKWLVPSL